VPWGWHTTNFGWASHTIVVNNAPWRRTYANRLTYVHPYTVPRYAPAVHDEHRVIQRSPQEREAARRGERKEDHHDK
jgi:hypothetical protein